MSEQELDVLIKGMPRLRYRSSQVLLEDAKRNSRYWWWAYLRLSPDYWWTCTKLGRVDDKRLRNMYLDFGNIFEQSFEDWWKHRGVRLFGEEIALPEVRLIDKRNPRFSRGNIDYLVVEIPLNLTERTIKKQVITLVKSAEGRQIERISTAPRPLAKLKGIRKDVLEVAYQTYQLHYESRIYKSDGFAIGEPEGTKSLYQIGKELRLVKTCMPVLGDATEKARQRVNGMKVAVSRMLKRADNLSQNACVGVFPCVQKIEAPIVWSKRNIENIQTAIIKKQFRPLFNDDDTLRIIL